MDRRRATYQDVIDAPPELRAEILDGELVLSTRPAAPHLLVASALGAELHTRLRGPRRDDPSRPGGWVIVAEPECWLGTGGDPREVVIVPDVAAWRRERWPRGFRGHGHVVVPDLVVEVLSPSTARRDRLQKADLYAAAGVPWSWIVDPDARTVEVFALRDGVWARVAAAAEGAAVPLPPFEVGLDVGTWWADLDDEEVGGRGDVDRSDGPSERSGGG